MNSIAKNTYCILPANGTFMSIKVGYTDWTTDKIVENVNDVLKFFMESKYPSGGLIKNKKMIESINIKTSDSISLPIFKAKHEQQDEESDLSDF